MRLAVAEELRAEGDGARHRWRAGGLLLQFLPKEAERARPGDLDPGDVPAGMEVMTPREDDAWVEGRSLVGTIADVELLDPEVSSEQLLYRLFHERGVRVFRSRQLHAQCSCSRTGVEQMLRSFPQDDREHMVGERQDHGHLRILQLELRVRAGGGERALRQCPSRPPGRHEKPAPRRSLRVPDREPAPDGAQLIVRSRCGVSSEKAGMSMSNCSPLALTIP